MAIHFLQSKAARTLSLAYVFRMTDAEAEATFCKIRWSETDGAPVCPSCGGLRQSPLPFSLSMTARSRSMVIGQTFRPRRS